MAVVCVVNPAFFPCHAWVLFSRNVGLEQKISWLADRHLVVFVGEQEVCRGGVPAPAPPTEGSSWAYDLWSSEAAAAAAAAAAAGGDAGGSGGGSGGGGGGSGGRKGGSGRARGVEVRWLASDGAAAAAVGGCGRWSLIGFSFRETLLVFFLSGKKDIRDFNRNFPLDTLTAPSCS